MTSCRGCQVTPPVQTAYQNSVSESSYNHYRVQCRKALELEGTGKSSVRHQYLEALEVPLQFQCFFPAPLHRLYIEWRNRWSLTDYTGTQLVCSQKTTRKELSRRERVLSWLKDVTRDYTHRVHGLAEKQHLHGQKLPLSTLPPPSLSLQCFVKPMLFSLLIRVLSTTGARRSADLSQISLYELVEEVFLYLSVKSGFVWLTLKTFDDFSVKTSELAVSVFRMSIPNG